MCQDIEWPATDSSTPQLVAVRWGHQSCGEQISTELKVGANDVTLFGGTTRESTTQTGRLGLYQL